jgi:hypothetical protein
MVLSLSVSAVKCRFGCNVLKSVRMDWMSVSSGSKIRRISTTNRK